MQEIPCGGLSVTFRGRLSFLLLPQCDAIGLFLCLALLLLALLWRRQKVAERGMRLLVVGSSDRSSDNLWNSRGLELGLERKLEFEIVKNDKLELLPDWSGLVELQPRRGHTVQAIVEGQLEPCALIYCFVR
jgi:hypothetical protein